MPSGPVSRIEQPVVGRLQNTDAEPAFMIDCPRCRRGEGWTSGARNRKAPNDPMIEIFG
jgi:hypothetical protein